MEAIVEVGVIARADDLWMPCVVIKRKHQDDLGFGMP